MDASEFDFKNFSLSDSIFLFEEYPITSVSVRIRNRIHPYPITSNSIFVFKEYPITFGLLVITSQLTVCILLT